MTKSAAPRPKAVRKAKGAATRPPRTSAKPATTDRSSGWRMLVVLNAKSGTMRTLGPDNVVAQVRKALSPVCISLEIALIEGALPDELAAKIGAGAYDCVVAGGGDGTISAMAARLACSSIALGALPLGTMNTIVRVLGFPQQLDLALAALATAVARSSCCGKPRTRTIVFIVPSGRAPSAMLLPASRAAIADMVPSPPPTTTQS